MRRNEGLSIPVSLVCLLLVAAAPSWATAITYEETLEDLNNPFVVFDFPQNLQRTRNFGDGSPPSVLDNDLLISFLNDVSDNFGKWDAEPVTYSHIFVPIGPVESFESLRLTITAASVNTAPGEGFPPDFIEIILGLGTPDDPVEGDGTPLGFFPPSPFFGESTFVFDTESALLIGMFLADDRLDVTITPTGPGFLLEPNGDKISVRSSRLEVTYNVPEPATVSLLALALLAAFRGAHWRRRG